MADHTIHVPPPPEQPPQEGGNRRGTAWKIAVPILVIAALLGIIAGVMLRGSDPAGATELVLEPVSSVGNDPFTAPLVPGAAGSAGSEIDPDVADQLNPPLGATPDIDFTGVDLPNPGEAGSSGTISISGGAPGLYGGTNQLEVCDKDQLTAFLTQNPDKAGAWADVHGIDVADIPNYIAGLTDVVLQTDTRVTNHGFADGAAYPIDSVLQAGTAVLVDSQGVPRVRCYCGNPLLEPRQLATDEPTLTGQTWPDFDLADAVVIAPGPEIAELVLDDITSDDFVVRAPGASLADSTVVDANGQPVEPEAPAAPVATPEPTATALPEPTAAPAPTPTPEPTPTPTAEPTPTPEPSPTPRPAPVDITASGVVSASSVFGPEFVAPLAVDGSRASSWFSAGGGTASFTWDTTIPQFIESIDILSNASHAVRDFRTGFGYESVTVTVFDRDQPVFSETIGLAGTPDPDVRSSPQVVGDAIVLEFSGGEDPTCGGFSELVVRGSAV